MVWSVFYSITKKHLLLCQKKHATIVINLYNCIFYPYLSSAPDNSPEKDSSSVSPESDSGNALFCCITKAAYEKGVAQQVEDDIRSSTVSAPKLVKTLNTNDALGYTDTKNLPSTKLFKLLDEHYKLNFDVRAFQIARSK